MSGKIPARGDRFHPEFEMNQEESSDIVPGPEFQLRDTAGNVIRLSDYRGKPVVLVLLRGFL